jgi:methyl-accepting chemotaxis protein
MNYFERRINSSIARKLIFYVLGAVLVMNVFMLVIIGAQTSRQANDFASTYSVSLSDGIASNVKVYIEQAFETSNTLANTLKALRFSPGMTREAIELILINVLTENDEYIAVWTMWEPFEFDGKDDEYMDDPLYEESDGRFLLFYYLEDHFVTISWSKMEEYDQPYYLIPKERGTKTILNPYQRSYTDNPDDSRLVTSLITPIIVEGEFVGVIGVDIGLDNMYSLVENVDLFNTGTAAIISHDMQIAAHINRDLIGKPFSEITEANLDQIQNAVKSSENYTFQDRTGSPLLRTFVPVTFYGMTEAWSVMSEIPLHEVTAGSRRLLTLIILIGIAGLIVISLVVYIAAQSITKPIMAINNVVKEAALGNLNSNVGFENRNDEVGKIARGMKQLLKGLKDTADFARKIGEGNYDEKHSKLSDEDELGEALLQMQKSLKDAKEEELKRKAEDDIRNWVTRGQAQFADITRKITNDVNELSYLIISNLVKYMGINQGGLFLLNDNNPEDKFIELTACYAFDRRKYLQKRISLGEGLVGTCFVEKKNIYMEKIPENYMQITSGLGDDSPRALLITPLKVNEEIFGVIELASFHPFKKHEIEFTEIVGEIIASAISSLRTANNTKMLLEKSQQQAEDMRAQEEEMRQNMEELSATQEAMSEKERISQEKIRELTIRIEELTKNSDN